MSWLASSESDAREKETDRDGGRTGGRTRGWKDCSSMKGRRKGERRRGMWYTPPPPPPPHSLLLCNINNGLGAGDQYECRRPKHGGRAFCSRSTPTMESMIILHYGRLYSSSSSFSFKPIHSNCHHRHRPPPAQLRAVGCRRRLDASILHPPPSSSPLLSSLLFPSIPFSRV